MHISPCERPVRIYNRYLNKIQYVPDGKCYTCRSKRAYHWVNRLKDESLCHAYTIFFTLTYSEDNVPLFNFEPDGVLSGRFYGENRYIVPDNTDEKSIKLLDANNGRLRVLDKQDVQLFVKRFRRHLDYEYKRRFGKDSVTPSVRYYICGEYGSTTYRPHYHGIFWFDSDFIKERFDDFLSKSWSVFDKAKQEYSPIGFVDWSFVKDSAASYVASYVNCFDNLPSLLQTIDVRPFAVFSKRPPIGSLLQSSKDIREIFDKGLTFTVRKSDAGKRCVVSPLLPSIRNRLFPKCPRYSIVSSSLRFTLYSVCQRFGRRDDFDRKADYEEYLKSSLLKFLEDSKQYDLLMYFSDLTSEFVDFKPFFNLCRISERVFAQAEIFGVSVYTYVKKIEQYYDNVDKVNNRLWFAFSEEYSKTHSQLDLIKSDIDFCCTLYTLPSSFNYEKLCQYQLDSFALSSSDGVLTKSLSYVDTYDYRVMKNLSYKIFTENTKTKKKNDYLNAHPELAFYKNF